MFSGVEELRCRQRSAPFVRKVDAAPVLELLWQVCAHVAWSGCLRRSLAAVGAWNATLDVSRSRAFRLLLCV